MASMSCRNIACDACAPACPAPTPVGRSRAVTISGQNALRMVRTPLLLGLQSGGVSLICDVSTRDGLTTVTAARALVTNRVNYEFANFDRIDVDDFLGDGIFDLAVDLQDFE